MYLTHIPVNVHVCKKNNLCNKLNNVKIIIKKKATAYHPRAYILTLSSCS